MKLALFVPAVEGDGEVVTGRRNLTAADADVPLGQAAGDVQAQGIVDAGVVEDAGVDHKAKQTERQSQNGR